MNTDLMIKRFLVIAEDTSERFKVGDILKLNFGFIKIAQGNNWYEAYINKFPHLFRELQWYEERAISEMPEYVKIVRDECSIIPGTIVKPKEWGRFPDEGRKWGNEGHIYALLEITEESKTHDAGEEIKMHCINLRPATEQEYNDYIKKSI